MLAIHQHAEISLTALGCMKVILQILKTNEATADFYHSLAYQDLTIPKAIRAKGKNTAKPIVMVTSVITTEAFFLWEAVLTFLLGRIRDQELPKARSCQIK